MKNKLKNDKNDKLLVTYTGGLNSELERELLDFLSKHEFNFVGSVMDIKEQIRELEFESKYFKS